MDLFLYYQIPISRLVSVLLFATILLVLIIGGVLALVKLYHSRLRALEAEKQVMQFHVEEATRRRIATDLHSSIGQSITMAVSLAADIGQRLTGLPPDHREDLDRLQTMLADGLTELRLLSQVLHGTKALENGLVEALRKDLLLLARVSTLFVHTQLPSAEPSLSDESRVLVYRIVQDAISNIVRHAEASHVDVVMTVEAKTLCLRIEDDGVGFNADAAVFAGLGMEAMAQRAAQLGGALGVQSAEGNGTAISLNVPLNLPCI